MNHCWTFAVIAVGIVAELEILDRNGWNLIETDQAGWNLVKTEMFILDQNGWNWIETDQAGWNLVETGTWNICFCKIDCYSDFASHYLE